MRRMRYLTTIFIALLIATTTSIAAQQANLTVRGQVYEKGSKRALANVTISVREQTSIAATSGNDGHFSLTLPAAGHYTLIATASGFDAAPPLDIELKDNGTMPEAIFYLLPTATLNEIVVQAERSPDRISKTIITGDEIRRAPGTAGDALRAVQSLPGVAMGSDARSAPAVRGSGPSDNAYYADSLPIGQLFHIDGSSIFNSSLITDFNLYSAAFSPHYADVTGAILDVALRDPRSDRLGGKASVSLLGANVLLEGPVTGDQSFYFAARRSYFDLLIHQFSTKGITIQLPRYYDYQGKYLWHINADHRLSLYMNGAKDSIGFTVSGTSDTALTQPVLAGDSNVNTAYAMQAVVLDSLLSASAYNKLALGHTDTLLSSNIGSVGTTNADIKTSFLREQLNFQLADNHDVMLNGNYQAVTAGVDLNTLRTTCTQFNPNCDLTTAPRIAVSESILYQPWDISARDRWLILPQLTLIGGVRQTHENYLNRTYTEPRLGMEWAWSERTLLNAGWGKHNQMPGTQEILRNYGNPYLGHIHAEHRVVGITRTLDEGWTWKTEAYYKRISDLVVNDPTTLYINGGSGRAYGMELLIKKARLDRLSGWLSLTLARSERRNDLTGETFNFGYDQPVNATLVGTYKLENNWTLGAKWTYHTGNPYTPIVGTNGVYPDGRPIPLYGAINSERFPDYHRLDLRLDRTYVYDTWKLTNFFEIINAYAHKNVGGYDYGPNYDRKAPIYQLPFLPTFGVEAEF